MVQCARICLGGVDWEVRGPVPSWVRGAGVFDVESVKEGAVVDCDGVVCFGDGAYDAG